MTTPIDVDALLADAGPSSVKSMCYKTVDTFAGIVQRKLWLRNAQDGQAKTNGHMIEVPFDDPRAYEYTEHELSHILFGSDALAAAKFIDLYAAMITKVARKGGASINERAMRRALGDIVCILDDERVISLWGLLYEGSAAIIRRMKHDQSVHLVPRAHDGFLPLLSALAGGQVVPAGKLDRYKPYMLEALRKVHLRDFYGALVAAKWLITMLVAEIIRESQGEPPPNAAGFAQGLLANLSGDAGSSGDPDGSQSAPDGSQDPSAVPDPSAPDDGSTGAQGDAGGDADGDDDGTLLGGHDTPPWEPPQTTADLSERSKAMSKVVDAMGQLPRDLRKALQDVEESKYKRKDDNFNADAMARAALKSDVKDSAVLEQNLQYSTKQMSKVVEEARSAVKNALTEDDRIRHESFAKVVFTDVRAPLEFEVDEDDLEDETIAEDEETVKRLRAQFFKVMGRRRSMLEETGTEVDIPALIERRLTGQDLPVFRTERYGRGFKSLVLIDRSSSMHGSRTRKAERACRIISRALKFPFVENDVWGFQSRHDGEVNITRFERGREVFDSDQSRVGGMTPLHTAVKVAARALEAGTERKHLFVISDGWPVFASRAGAFGTRSLMAFVRGNVHKARTQGIGVTGVLIGRDMDAKGMAFMFGPPKYWRLMGDKTFHHDLVHLVSQSFVEYLRMG